MLDDHHGVACLHQAVQDIQQFLDIGEVQTGGGFIQDIERLAAPVAAEFFGQLDPLCLPAAQGGGALSQLKISQAHIHQCAQDMVDLGMVREELEGLPHIHVQHLGDIEAVVLSLPGNAPPASAA